MTDYVRISGTGLERLNALSDGVFAVAMTLLVLDLRAPVVEVAHAAGPVWSAGSELPLWHALSSVAPTLLTYVMSFMTLGIFWVAQHTQLRQVSRTDRDLTWLNLLYLAVVGLMPFTTSLLSEYITYRIALVVYWANLLLLGLVLWLCLRYTRHAGLFADGVAADVFAVQQRRIAVYQALYFAVMLVGFLSTYAAIAGLILVQLTSEVAPFRGGQRSSRTPPSAAPPASAG
jgi:uncharacterized membrane protein